MSIERETAIILAHRARVAETLAETGGEVIHPDHYQIREGLRLSVLGAIDGETAARGLPRMSDGQLPELFRVIDGIAERLFLKSVGLEG